MGLLAGQVCIVTGAGQGLGRSVALEMIAEGAKVMLLERNADTVRAVAVEVAPRPLLLDVRELTAGRDLAVTTDHTSATQCPKPQEPHQTHCPNLHIAI